ncbi:hypothetical protein [Streptomyces mirabilis]
MARSASAEGFGVLEVVGGQHHPQMRHEGQQLIDHRAEPATHPVRPLSSL